MNERVTIVDIDIPFGKMVGIILKWSLASIPAMILLWAIIMIVLAIFGGILGGIGSMF